ncbi:unnamed protein product [Owenia fusiformis]|uniref:Sodium/hydrogen exchanger n=1 Tax=Owenia fusiformis TaxID=6347 RepID=A0A8J1T7K8_OWEFU|nr:unnamed protein product [Owenia fusiformis]
MEGKACIWRVFVVNIIIIATCLPMSQQQITKQTICDIKSNARQNEINEIQHPVNKQYKTADERINENVVAKSSDGDTKIEVGINQALANTVLQKNTDNDNIKDDDTQAKETGSKLSQFDDVLYAESDAKNTTDTNGTNHTRRHGHGIHLVNIRYAYVREPLILFVFLVLVNLAKVGFHHADFLSSLLPESCLLIILGVLIGVIFRYNSRLIGFFDITDKVFFLILLPPIILEAAYSLYNREFVDNVGTILLYAVVGTIINCFVIGPCLFGLAKAGAMGSIDISLLHCLVFSGFIVAVDPVAVLSIFQEIGVNDSLYILVFGESLLNDGVTVVLYNTMQALANMETIPIGQYFLAILSFLTIALGGTLVGVFFGVLTALITRITKHVRVVEPFFVLGLGYLSYLTAELFHWSGILSAVGCGLVQAHYTRHNISKKSYTTVVYFIKMLSVNNEAVIFMILGVDLVTEELGWHTGFVLWTLALCLIVRFIVVYGLTFLANKHPDRIRKINREEQFIMAYGGLRGAIAFALGATLEDDTVRPHKRMFVTATQAVIIFTVFVQGVTIKPMVKLLRIRTRETGVESTTLIEETNIHVFDHINQGVEAISGRHGENYVREWLLHIDQKYFQKWLCGTSHSKLNYLVQIYKETMLRQHLSNLWQPGNKDELRESGEPIDNGELRQALVDLERKQSGRASIVNVDTDPNRFELGARESNGNVSVIIDGKRGSEEVTPQHLHTMFHNSTSSDRHRRESRNLLSDGADEETTAELVGKLNDLRQRFGSRSGQSSPLSRSRGSSSPMSNPRHRSTSLEHNVPFEGRRTGDEGVNASERRSRHRHISAPAAPERLPTIQSGVYLQTNPAGQEIPSIVENAPMEHFGDSNKTRKKTEFEEVTEL